jgi:DNA-binding MarR family transcriptional regulator
MADVEAMPTAPLGILRWPTFGLGQLYRSAHARLEARLADEDQSLRTYYVLTSLFEHDNLSQQEVCDRIELDRSDMVRLIDDLEARGLVVRTRDTRDRRRYRLSLTTEGRRALSRCDKILDDVTNDVFSALSPDERRTLHRLTLRALGQPEAIADLLDVPRRRRAVSHRLAAEGAPMARRS